MDNISFIVSSTASWTNESVLEGMLGKEPREVPHIGDRGFL